MMKYLLLVLALCVLAPATVATQGQGVGTLPRTGPTRHAAWLDAFSTIQVQTDPGARLLIVSTHNNEGELMQPGTNGPDDPTVLEATWRSRHTTFHLRCPMWVSEAEDGQAGSDRWHARFGREVTEAHLHFPPDGT